MLIMTREKTDEDKIEKFHITQPNFNIMDVYKVKSFIRRNVTKVVTTEHFNERKKEKHIPLPPIHAIMQHGRIFEIKTIKGMLYRFAIRIRDKYGDDIIYVIQPLYVGENNVHVTIVSAYKNNADDTHKTLDTNLYE